MTEYFACINMGSEAPDDPISEALEEAGANVVGGGEQKVEVVEKGGGSYEFSPDEAREFAREEVEDSAVISEGHPTWPGENAREVILAYAHMIDGEKPKPEI